MHLNHFQMDQSIVIQRSLKGPCHKPQQHGNRISINSRYLSTLALFGARRALSELKFFWEALSVLGPLLLPRLALYFLVLEEVPLWLRFISQPPVELLLPPSFMEM